MNLIPQPRSINLVDGQPCRLDHSTAIVSESSEGELAARFLRERPQALCGMVFAPTPRTDASTIEFRIGACDANLPATQGRRADGADPAGERYKIEVAEDAIRVVAPTAEGLFRGAVTLVQLIADTANEGTCTIPAMTIDDAPTYAWRGLNLDVVRSFHDVEMVKRVIDLLALYKFNVLHMHLTDSEGWRLPIDEYPDLIEKSSQGAVGQRRGGFYSREQYAEILQYAADHFITVVPEFDSPGHTASVINAYPDLASKEIRDMDRAMQYLDPNRQGVMDLVKTVIDDMASMHPGAAIHVGGDEAIAMPPDLYLEYMRKLMPLARATGKTVVAWQEAARGELKPGDILQHWVSPLLVERFQRTIENPTEEERAEYDANPVLRGFLELFITADKDLAKGVAQGADILLSQSNLFYLDTQYPEPSIDPAQEELRNRLGLKVEVYENGTVADSYDFMPDRLQADLPSDRIVGLEAHIWGETIEQSEEAFFLLLPRLPGIADKGWSDERSWEEFRPVLASHAQLWDAMGLPYFKSSVVFTG